MESDRKICASCGQTSDSLVEVEEMLICPQCEKADKSPHLSGADAERKQAGKKNGSVSAIISLVLGIMCFVVPVPRIFPVFGLALGANAILKQIKKPVRDRQVIVMAIIGIVLSLFVHLMFLLHAISE